MDITISQPTRQAARCTKVNMIASGKLATILDNGKHLKGTDRWQVVVIVPETATVKRKVSKVISSVSNKGFDLRKVTTGRKGFDCYYDGVFLLRRDTKIAAYTEALKMAHSAKLNVSTLSYK